MTQVPYCHCCPGEPEDLNHLFKSYVKVREIRPKLMENKGWEDTKHLSFTDWCAWNLRNKTSPGIEGQWREHFTICKWWIWHWRNDSLFQNKELLVGQKLMKIKEYTLEVNKVFAKQISINDRDGSYATVWVG